MTLLETSPESSSPQRSRPAGKGWFGQLLLRLHFYAGIFVGPFILVAALSGALYSVMPQVEQAVYARELHAPVADAYLPLAQQIEAANAYLGDQDTPAAVRPAPNPGDTTRVMYSEPGLGASEMRAVFVDPATAEIRGDLTTYGTSGSLPLRTWVDQLHRNLHLGEPGRLYSEMAASWLGIIALAGIGLWVQRIRKTKRKKDLLRPSISAKGYRKLASWHGSLGLWILIGAFFLSATGITWSTFGGANVGEIRSALNWGTPSVNTDLSDSADSSGDEHAHHHGVDSAQSGKMVNPAAFDTMLSIGREININTQLVEIKPPAAEGKAWVVQEIQRSFPTEVDAVSINGQSLEVVDRVDFNEFGLVAKLSRWGIDIHMGTMFGLPNQVLLFLLASAIAAMVVLGYAMWWKRRPTRNSAQLMGKPPRRGAMSRAPWWGSALLLLAAAAVGILLPLLGISLAAFLAVDLMVGKFQARRVRRASGCR
ncbi:peptidase [Glutamicibacter halophytocola]|uniref:PepSY-associated TM helix domain-containing protein n=1 Tax=Glutamicibacter halophytocola TaxID=1933880 RepID=UPI0006D4C371|nr:PepSY-associated TM helix domain-containing protein [Glutamicibacter halophytocola]ALG30457.1 peptidase [Glutamicibacter halophytocola]